LRGFCEAAAADASLDLFFRIIESLNFEFLVMRTFAAALFVVPVLAQLFEKLDGRFNELMTDELSLRSRDRFLVKVAEKETAVDESLADLFVHCDAPLSMRMFFDYAVALSTARKDVSPQKLNFATFLGFTIMKEIETFIALVNSLWVGGDFIALCDLYFQKAGEGGNGYHRETAAIVQGRQLVAVSKVEKGFRVRKVKGQFAYRLSASFAFWLETPAPNEKEESDSGDHPAVLAG
jgi:hypothetical protein